MGIRFVHLGCALAVLLTATTTAVGQTVEQTQMARRVATALKESGELTGRRVGVKYQDGVAWLVGTVSDQDQMAAAVAVAEQVDGVDRVISKLQFEGEPAAPAEPVQTRVAETEPSLLYDSLQQSLMEVDARETAAAPTPRPMRQPVARSARPLPVSAQQAHAIRMAAAQQHRAMPAAYQGGAGMMPQGHVPAGGGAQVSYDNAHLPGYAWPSYAAHPNYAALTYPKQYSPTAWPYIGPFYPYPQVPLGWRKVTLEWDDGWWMLDFSHRKCQ